MQQFISSLDAPAIAGLVALAFLCLGATGCAIFHLADRLGARRYRGKGTVVALRHDRQHFVMPTGHALDMNYHPVAVPDVYMAVVEFRGRSRLLMVDAKTYAGLTKGATVPLVISVGRLTRKPRIVRIASGTS